MLPIEINIRKAVDGDIPGIVRLWKILREIHVKHFGYDKEFFRHKESAPLIYRKFIKGVINSEEHALFVAEAGGKPVGHVLAGIDKSPPIYVHERKLNLIEFIVDPDFRGRGIGKKLLKKAEEWGKEKGLSFFILHVAWKNERAASLYRGFGFDETHKMMCKKIT